MTQDWPTRGVDRGHSWPFSTVHSEQKACISRNWKMPPDKPMTQNWMSARTRKGGETEWLSSATFPDGGQVLWGFLWQIRSFNPWTRLTSSWWLWAARDSANTRFFPRLGDTRPLRPARPHSQCLLWGAHQRQCAAGSLWSEINTPAGHRAARPSLSQSGNFGRNGCHCWTKPEFQIFPICPHFPQAISATVVLVLAKIVGMIQWGEGHKSPSSMFYTQSAPRDYEATERPCSILLTRV